MERALNRKLLLSRSKVNQVVMKSILVLNGLGANEVDKLPQEALNEWNALFIENAKIALEFSHFMKNTHA